MVGARRVGIVCVRREAAINATSCSLLAMRAHLGGDIVDAVIQRRPRPRSRGDERRAADCGMGPGCACGGFA